MAKDYPDIIDMLIEDQIFFNIIENMQEDELIDDYEGLVAHDIKKIVILTLPKLIHIIKKTNRVVSTLFF
ncbi:MAG: hypothetical protein K0Q49_1503 [Haloplasmataceae bacterium]|jgi:hypothetical protein|nr:hypothetical protein [Haloplasmataceae bacterium]